MSFCPLRLFKGNFLAGLTVCLALLLGHVVYMPTASFSKASHQVSLQKETRIRVKPSVGDKGCCCCWAKPVLAPHKHTPSSAESRGRRAEPSLLFCPGDMQGIEAGVKQGQEWLLGLVVGIKDLPSPGAHLAVGHS